MFAACDGGKTTLEQVWGGWGGANQTAQTRRCGFKAVILFAYFYAAVDHSSRLVVTKD